MLSVGQFFSRHTASFLISLTTVSITTIAASPGYFLGGILFAGTYASSTALLKYRQKKKFMQIAGITKEEYKHIESQLTAANKNIQTLSQNYLRVRSVSAFKQLLEMTRISKNIVKIVKTDPRKFYNVEQFFYAHLPSAVELTDKYTMLSRQPVKDKEIQITLSKTRETLTDLNDTIQTDLKDALSNDIDHLQMEIEFANRSNIRRKEQLEWRGDDK
ncbi:5-bromo-4-chloroindolyl phosphate hydrolysis family protein [Lysinibacillus xylanilyticus]|uniref:5-bromo-4-chloroindolyl phosphate hydrolysis family protein n=1 Tax=Lysinibacillus xylanilyticus TaxID=582475 RepID=UPI002B249D0F|nr:5-bromo-4-chloroindolyl phosphate hydrolysis family protein [Lysinibacillus xylanilyticus]MEB2279387.1 5-bromo-4-chloroindolyl phosphate hydrolysis family protein [Lysinibacillus xylanilyticus]